ncbi:MAG TPA: hypothetical protein VK705_06530 [Ferruginibacter sp.]|jgi:hypothetical protein|nr:hypothetical protein [Ferruginibacter sp.]
MNWDNFFIAQVSAAATLTGLIFVSVSINLTRILEGLHLPSRALQSIMLLLNILLISSFMLVPGQSLIAQGIEILVLGLILWTIIFNLSLSILRTTPTEYKKTARINFYLIQVVVLPFLAAGIYILFFGEKGIYFLVAGILFSFLKAIADSWVLLIEINR